MKNYSWVGASVIIIFIGLLLGLPPKATNGQSGPPPYKDPSLPIEKRVDDLVSRMTLEEKVSQMMNAAPAIKRLDIPEYEWWNEGLHGVARAGYATVFPQAIGLAATWDTDLMHEVADVISTEARAKHHEFLRHNQHARYQGLTYWSPNINIFHDPQNVGNRAGDEVIQLYVSDVAASVPVPIRSLAGTNRVFLKPGEKRHVSFTLSPTQMSLIDDNGKRVIDLEKTQPGEPYILATLYVGLGDKDKAFVELERSFNERGYYVPLLRVDPLMDPLRDDPRFADLIKRIGLPK